MEVNIDEATSQLSQLIERAMKGDDLTIAQAGRPLVRLIPIHVAGLGKGVNIWWAASVPYAIIFDLILEVFPGYRWEILHAFGPFLIYYWLAYYSSLVWTLVGGSMTIFNRSRSVGSVLKVVLGLAAIVVPRPLSHGWPGF